MAELVRGNVDTSRVTVVPGWYSEVLTDKLRQSLSIKQAAVILIDCDLYGSSVPVLDFVAPYIQDGTILIFDDWFSYKGRPDMGEARAFHEWLQRNPCIGASVFYRAGRTMMSFVAWRR